MIESQNNKMIYQLTGESNRFPFPMRIMDKTDLHVFLGNGKEETELVYGTDYTVESTNMAEGATVVIHTAAAQGQTLAIVRICSHTQMLALPEYGKLPSTGIETALDKLTMICQQIWESIGRTLTIKQTDPRTPDDVLSELFHAQNIAAAEADRAEKAANAAIVNGEKEVQKAKYWAEAAKDAVVSGDITYDELGTSVIITPDVVYDEDEILYDVVQ